MKREMKYEEGEKGLAAQLYGYIHFKFSAAFVCGLNLGTQKFPQTEENRLRDSALKTPKG